ncbi:Uncharacterized HTH-type transcriptional regulator yusO [Listeria grayi]|uniref:Transcriptional regulator, MarR family n=3 Tax=Listeria grayi TaxID=1641 RepID=D7UYR0_LISGR|nr:MarR family transcriptional regulator [Listeria grayi]EFI83477.1 transcriptional regulator, MarR family [Listeria grayi DSM 20601]EUJ29733.1 MarR family transcriptional regulator [Listeria grayi FSL F6-1183]MBC1920828.1 MarR family transcriptional regulator [Listeria grayi]STY43474.1 Uncharacterized HTH-type transcriptional regulator yusO [Listeria grayi]VEI34541.1 Uncharacterized HTH-type transcriptional regulator yusO [Listeria grayi]
MEDQFIRDIIFSFREVQKKTQHFFAEEASKRDITTTQLMALNFLKREPSLTLGELADRMKLGKSTVSGVVDRLVRAEFLKRSRDATNRRCLNLELTEIGEEKAAVTYDLFFKRLKPIEEIDAAELESMLETHRKIIAILEREASAN